MRLPLAILALLSACVSAGSNPPSTFVQSTAEVRTTRLLDVRDGLPKAQAMRILSDALGERYTLEVTDAHAGFVMTSWQAGLMSGGVPDLRYRTRITAKFLGEDWRKLQLRDEANWARGDEWEIGFDAAQLDSTANELRLKLGPRP